MDFLKNAPKFSFLYGGQPYDSCVRDIKQSVTENEVITTYLLDGGLQFTNTAKKYGDYGAYEWVNCLENVGSENTPVISELWDCDCELPLSHRDKQPASPWTPSRETSTCVFNPNGSTTVDEYDFYTHIDDSCQRTSFLMPMKKARTFRCEGGRSSNGNAPYFNVHDGGRGYFIAVGWTGQWNCRLSRTTDMLRVQSKIEDTHFCLLPGERIRTSSVVILPYEGGVEESFNLWRRFVKQHVSPVKGGVEELPLALSIWGGTPSDEYLRRMDYAIEQKGLPFNYVWTDAGWCGIDTLATRNEFSGDWAEHVGDFRISPLIHPQGFTDVSEWIHSRGKRWILWFEPERVRMSVPLVREHPEYLLFDSKPSASNALLNLGCEEAWQYCADILCGLIERLHVDCYRQDFNIAPLDIWRANDTPDRRGITEIKHIMGLYRLWDHMLARFPWLLIDNCASGGKRLDIEMMRRSIPLWRSDAQCPADPIPEITQANQMNFSLWMPYSGTGSGRVYDTYAMRSAYACALSTTYSYSADEQFDADPARAEWLRARCEEYLRVRPYFDGDIYHLTPPTRDDLSWSVTQWHRPEAGDGLLQVFKRAACIYPEVQLPLRAIDPGATYRVTDLDGGTWEITGERLLSEGLGLRIEEQRVAKLYLYERIG